MKWLAVAFLVANVLVYGSQLSKEVRESALVTKDIRALPSTAPSLRLLSELSELPKQRAEAPNAQQSAGQSSNLSTVDLDPERNDLSEASESCVAIGPITKKQQLEILREWLRGRTSIVQTRMETVRERRFFWVYLESTTGAQAFQKLNDLERRGVTDYMLIRRGGLKNSISLGLFHSQDSVNRRLAEMSRQGYKPVVVPKFESTDHYFISATMAIGFEDIKLVPAEVLGDASIESRQCPSPSEIVGGETNEVI